MSAVASYSGTLLPPKCLRSKKEAKAARVPRPMTSPLGQKSSDAALILFKAGCDTKDIAIALHCTEAVAANALARAREVERAR